MKENWIMLHDDDDKLQLKLSLKHKYPETDSDLTIEKFLEPSEIEYALFLNNDVKAWVKIDSFDKEKPRNGVNLGVVIFDKAPVFKELYNLMLRLSVLFEEVIVFTQKNSTTDKLIQKMNETFDNKLLTPFIDNIIAYKYKKGQ